MVFERSESLLRNARRFDWRHRSVVRRGGVRRTWMNHGSGESTYRYLQMPFVSFRVAPSA